jgi:hypothetical protein
MVPQSLCEVFHNMPLNPTESHEIRRNPTLRTFRTTLDVAGRNQTLVLARNCLALASWSLGVLARERAETPLAPPIRAVTPIRQNPTESHRIRQNPIPFGTALTDSLAVAQLDADEGVWPRCGLSEHRDGGRGAEPPAQHQGGRIDVAIHSRFNSRVFSTARLWRAASRRGCRVCSAHATRRRR